MHCSNQPKGTVGTEWREIVRESLTIAKSNTDIVWKGIRCAALTQRPTIEPQSSRPRRAMRF